jgi:hypothetical protein
MYLFGLAADEIPQHWDAIEPLAKGFERQCKTFTADQLRDLAHASKQQVFGIASEQGVIGFASTEIQNTAEGLICVIVAAFGTGPEEAKRELLERIRVWAKEVGCRKVRINGRKGWLRWDRRFQQTGVVMECEL